MGKKKAASEDQIEAIAGILSKREIQKLRDAYKWESLRTALNYFIPAHIPAGKAYAAAIGDQFYPAGDMADDSETERLSLSQEDRERCLIAVLTARGPDANLAIHVYMALMNGITQSEIADIIFLAGVYSGVDCLTEGLKLAGNTLKLLRRRIEAKLPLDAVSILKAINAEL